MRRDFIGITVISPSYREVGKEAVKRFKEFTGMEVLELKCPDKMGFQTKLELDLHHRGPCIFFDADFWWLREWKPDPCGGVWVAVHDPLVAHPNTFARHDCERFKMDKTQYFNSGMFICDLSLKEHRRVFQEARKTWVESKSSQLVKMKDHTDQTHLNLAIQNLQAPRTLLPFSYNYYHFAVTEGGYPYTPSQVTCLHGAGIQPQFKMSKMHMQATFLGEEIAPILPETMALHHALNYQIR